MTIFNQTKLRLSVGDAIKALLGKTIHLSTEIDVTNETEVVATRQTVHVDPLIRRKKPAMLSESADAAHRRLVVCMVILLTAAACSRKLTQAQKTEQSEPSTTISKN